MLRAALLGQFRILLDDKPVEIASRPAQTLLAYLLLNRGIVHRREQLAGLLWPDSLESTARKNLRNAVWQLRKAIGERYVLTDKETVAFNADAPYDLDIAALATETGETDAEALIAAVSVYKGELLPGFYEDWVQLERERLRALFERRMQALLDQLTAAGRWPDVSTWAEHWIAQGHVPEPAYRALMLACAARGDLAGVATAYRRCVQALKEELDVSPSPETQALYERLSRGEAPSVANIMAGAPRTLEMMPGPAQRFVEQELLAVGGQGEVYRGQDSVTGQLVVIKRLQRSAAAKHPELAARFVREGELLQQLDHPNIVKVLATFEREGQHAIVLEHVPGGTLQDLLDSKTPLPIEQILSIGLELADALSRAHHLGVIHRDLKPGNVLLAADGTPRLTDFGLARFERHALRARLTQTGMVVGSPIYMSPEALQNQELDARSDIWSFGVLLYEVLAGRAPFEGNELATLIAQILHEPAPAVTQFRPDTPAPLADLIHRMLVKDREQRVSSMRQVAAELEAIRAGRPLESASEGAASPGVLLAAAAPSPPLAARRKAQAIRFCTAPDGARIACATMGDGPALVKAANWLSHLEFDWNSPVWRHWLIGLSDQHTLIRYDQRGCGLSDWEAEDLSMDAFVQDLETVVDALGLERFPLLGISGGGAVAIAYAERHPEKVSHLILYGAYSAGRNNRTYAPQEVEKAKTMLGLIKVGWGQDNPAFRQFFTTLFMPEATAEQASWYNDLQRVSTSPQMAYNLQKASYDRDVRDLLARVTTPTLILHSRQDAVVPFEEGRRLAARLPQARFVPLESKNHILLETEPAWPRFLVEVHQFLQTEPETPPGPMSREVTPPPRHTPSMETGPTVRHNLPAQPTPFIGREQKLAEIRQLLVDEPACRLLTLVGSGGMGKTRLALEAAASVLNAFPHGVYFVPLASVGEAAHAVPAIVKAMDLNPSGPTPPKTELLNYLHDAKQPMLLLIDNLEHVLEGADVLSELLSAAPQLKLLATSRERLNLQEEWVFEVRGMASPPVGAPLTDAADLEKYNAARLFLQRARQADARFHPSTDDVPAIARICQLVDGMPLGLELAAPWVRSMTCLEIADEIERNLDFLTTTMRNVPERHRSLSAVLEQTWERLTQVERDALRQLSVFQGGCTREAAEAVTGASVATLSSLVGRALLRRVRDGRYELHELIRQFAAEKLQPGDQEAAQQRHTDYFTRLAERARPELDGPDQLAWFDRLEREHPNLRAALTWGLAHNLTLGLQLAVALTRFWNVRGYLSEGRRWLHDLLTSGDSAPQALRAGALVVASRLAYSQGDFRAALDLAQSGQDLSLQLENALGIAQAQLALGLAYLGLGDYVSARTHMEESLALCRSEADQPAMAEAFNALGHIAQRQGDYAAAKSFFAQALELYRGLNDPRNTAGMSLNLGVRAFEQGDYETAHRLTEASLAVFRQLRDTNGITTALLNLGNTLLETGNLDRARGYFEEAITLERSLGSGNVAIPLGGLGRALRRLGDLQGARACFAESLQLRLQAGDRRGVAVTLTNFAHIFQDDHRPDRAARLLGAAEALRTAIGAPIHPNRREEYEQLLAEVRAALGEAGFADGWAEGGVLTLEQAVALALK